MKKVIVFGASGRVGQRLVEYALAQQHQVVAFVRNPEKVKITHQNLKIVMGNVLNKDQVEAAISGQELVLSSLGRESGTADYSALTRGVENILSGMERFSVKRFLNIVGSGILNDHDYGQRFNRPGYPELFKKVSGANWKAYEYLQKSSLHWTMVCAPEMPHGERTGIYRTSLEYLPEGGKNISVEDVADFILNNLDQGNTYRKRIGIAY